MIIQLIAVLFFSFGVLTAQQTKKATDAKGLQIGVEAPMFNAIDENSIEFSLSDEIKKGPVVIIFYRGHWCPVCNKHLSQIQDSLKMIENLGAKVIAVSPEKPEFLNIMGEKVDAEFTFLYDENYKIAKAYDVDFDLSNGQQLKMNVFLGKKVKEIHSDIDTKLPIPATYIINQKGEIIWRQFDPDYKNRSSVKDIVEALKANK